MNPPRRLRGTFGMCNLREGFVNLREGFVVAPWRLREAFSKTRSAKASRSPLEGFAKASRRRHGRLHLETIRQKMTSPPKTTILFICLGVPDYIYLNRHTPSSQSQVCRVITQLRTDGVHCRESAGTGPVNLEVVPNECCLSWSPWTN